MHIDVESRRGFIQAAALASGGIILAGGAGAISATQPAGQEKPKSSEEEVTPSEDLMREHGVLRRILLIYQQAVSRLQENQSLPAQVLPQSATLVRDFVENYHEKLEENYLFPRFRKAGKLVDLVDVLQRQHQAGRQLTAVIFRQAGSQGSAGADGRQELVRAIQQFTRMYRPHAAREDTVLFPALHEVVSPAEYRALGETFEDQEQELFGREGFEKIVEQVAGLENTLGIYDLAQFTPKA